MTITTFLQHLAPMRLLTCGAGYLAESHTPAIAQPLIRAFIRHHHIDLSEALRSTPSEYHSFNDFFTRHLHPEARPLAKADWVSPADGIVTQVGTIEAARLIHAKGHSYSGSKLLADPALAHYLEGGHFTTVYLSPRDYHRVHMPCAGRLLSMCYVPGKLYSVRPDVVQAIDGLLARNERLICWFQHPQCGIFVMVLVGAAIVGSIHTTWHGMVNPRGKRQVKRWWYRDGNPNLCFEQGDEMGHFQLGSTVVVLMPKVSVKWGENWKVGGCVRQGQAGTNA